MGSLRPSFTIPPKFQSQLSVVSSLDNRSDTEILAFLEEFVPVTSEKNIWAFWHSGVKGLPAWCKRNVIDWFRINGPSWTVRVLDSDPSSPNFFLRYVPQEMFPNSIAKGTMTGSFVGQHTADFVRSATIFMHGGVFMDCGCLLIRRLDRFCWDKLTDDSLPWEVGVAGFPDQTLSNHFVAARKHNPFIKRWHELMLHLWKGKTEGKGTIVGNPLMEFLLQQNHKEEHEHVAALGWDFTDVVSALEYIAQILAWQRLCCLDQDDEEGFNTAEYWTKHVLYWNSLTEHWSAELLVHRRGPHPRIMQLLATRTDADPESEEYKAAYGLTWHILTSSCMQKITSARGLTITPHLGVLWEMPENVGKDQAEGTFAALLRYGSVHFEQTRKEINYLPAKKPEPLLHKGLLEP